MSDYLGDIPAKHILPEKLLSLDTWSPIVTNVTLYNSTTDKNLIKKYPYVKYSRPRIIYQYEIEIFTKTGGVTIIDGIEYPISHGDIKFLRPGQVVYSKLHYECYSCKFIFEGSSIEKNVFQPIFRNPCLDCIPTFLSAYTPNDYYKIFELMLNEYINPNMQTPILLKAKILELLCFLYSDSYRQNNVGTIGHDIADVVSKAMLYIRENYKEPITLSDISSHVNLSANYFHKIFKRAVTMTPLDYLIKIRIERAKILLITTQIPVTEIAEQCGFESTSYFSTLFGRQIGQRPGKFRKHKQPI